MERNMNKLLWKLIKSKKSKQLNSFIELKGKSKKMS